MTLLTAQFTLDHWASTFLIPSQLTRDIQHGCSLAHKTDRLIMPSLPSLYHFLLFLWYEGAVEMDLPKAPIVTDSARIQTHDLLIIGTVP